MSLHDLPMLDHTSIRMMILLNCSEMIAHLYLKTQTRCASTFKTQNIASLLLFTTLSPACQ
jgi:hypothetical protein